MRYNRRMSKQKVNPQYHRVWCLSCKQKKPPSITGAAFLIPVRMRPYDLVPGTASIDKRVMGACISCIDDKNKFQQSKKKPVDADNKHLVYRVE